MNQKTNRLTAAVQNGVNSVKSTALAVVPAVAAVASSGAMAQTGTDFSGILDGLSTATMVSAALAAGALIAIVGFTIWGAKRLARFF